jgi:hypothetical protein
MRIRLITAFILALGCAGTAIGLQEQEPQQQRPRVVTGRSKIATKYGIVAASQPLSARAGVQILERGGNAIDAAIAANAVEALVEPVLQRHSAATSSRSITKPKPASSTA